MFIRLIQNILMTETQCTIMSLYLPLRPRIGKLTINLALPSVEMIVALPSIVSSVPFTTCQLRTSTTPVCSSKVYLAPIQVPFSNL